MNLQKEWTGRLPVTQTHSAMWLCALDPQQHERTCGYWYTVTEGGGTPHTAFRTRAAALDWLALRGLSIDGDLPEIGKHGVFKVAGQYRTAMHLDYGPFFALEGVEIMTLSNAEVTLGIITTDADGLHTVHTLNPNLRRRPQFPYLAARRAEDAGDCRAPGHGSADPRGIFNDYMRA